MKIPLRLRIYITAFFFVNLNHVSAGQFEYPRWAYLGLLVLVASSMTEVVTWMWNNRHAKPECGGDR